MYTLMLARGMLSMKSSAQYMQLPLCLSLANLYLPSSFMLTHKPDRRETIMSLKVANVPVRILVELADEVTTIHRVDQAEMVGTRRLDCLDSTVDTALAFHHNTHHHIQHRYVYPFVLFLLTIRQITYLAVGPIDRARSQDPYTNFQFRSFAST
jgi:hypothetical protein